MRPPLQGGITTIANLTEQAKRSEKRWFESNCHHRVPEKARKALWDFSIFGETALHAISGSFSTVLKLAIIALWASDEAINQRLHARPKERGFTSDERIRPHIEYNRWIGRNRGKYQLFIDNEKRTAEETAGIIRKYIIGQSDDHE